MTGPAACFFFGNCPDVLPYFSIQGLRMSNLVYTGQTTAQRPYKWRAVEDNEPVYWNNYFVRTYFESIFHAQYENSNGYGLYALDCNSNGERGSKVGVDTMYLVTLQDYNSQYLQNDTLNNIMLINDELLNIQDFKNFTDLSKYTQNNSDVIRKGYFDFKLTEPPLNSNDEYRFKLIFILKSGEEFEKISEPVRLTK